MNRSLTGPFGISSIVAWTAANSASTAARSADRAANASASAAGPARDGSSKTARKYSRPAGGRLRTTRSMMLTRAAE
jgi:hypothetical protein